MPVCSVMTNSLGPQGRYPPRLLCLQNFPGKNTGVGSRVLLQGIFLTQGWNPYHQRLLHWQVGFFTTVQLGIAWQRGIKVSDGIKVWNHWLENRDIILDYLGGPKIITYFFALKVKVAQSCPTLTVHGILQSVGSHSLLQSIVPTQGSK